MRNRKAIFVVLPLVVLATFILFGCGSNVSSTPASATAAVRSYSGTASVGDFLTIQIDSNAGTITYSNHSNGESGTVPYTVNGNGTYTITDPTGNLVAAYEVPGDILLVESNKSGPNLSTPALITAVETKPATIASFAGQTFNYIQFRTASGGFEFGFVSIDAQGAITHDGYWPMGGMFQPPQTISGGSFAASSITEDPSGNYFSLSESNGSNDYVFGTQNGLPETVRFSACRKPLRARSIRRRRARIKLFFTRRATRRWVRRMWKAAQ